MVQKKGDTFSNRPEAILRTEIIECISNIAGGNHKMGTKKCYGTQGNLKDNSNGSILSVTIKMTTAMFAWT